MIMTVNETVSFQLPEEYQWARRFAEQHPEWTENTDSGITSFTRTQTYIYNSKEENT